MSRKLAPLPSYFLEWAVRKMDEDENWVRTFAQSGPSPVRGICLLILGEE